MLLYTQALLRNRFYTQPANLNTQETFARPRFFTQHFYTQDLLRKQTFPRKLLHTETLTHRCLWTLLHSGALGNTLRTGAVAPAFLHTEAFAHKRLDTPKRLHSEGSTNRWFSNICIFTQAHRRLYRQHADTFAQKVLNFYSESHRYFYTDSLYKPIRIYFYTHTQNHLHTEAFYTCFYADALTQRAFAHRELLHTKPIPHANNLLDAGAFTHKTFCTRKLPTPVRRKNIPLLPPFSGSTRVSFREYGQ